MTRPNVYTNGAAVDATPQNQNEDYLDGRTQNIMGDQINASAGIPATAVAATLAGNTTLVDDITDLSNSLSTIVSNQLGLYDAWNEMLPVEGDTLVSITGNADTGGGGIDIAAGGRIKMMGHDLTTKALTAVCFHTGGGNNRDYTEASGNVQLEVNSVYALRICSGAPGYTLPGAVKPTPDGATGSSTAAHFTEATVDSLACRWELAKITTGRFYRGTVSSVTQDLTTGLAPRQTIEITSGAGPLMGSRVRVLASGTEFSPPWVDGSNILFPNTVAGVAVADEVLINSDLLTNRINSISVSGSGTTASPFAYRQDQDGAPIPQDGLVAIIVTGAATSVPYVVRMPVTGGIYNGNRSMIAESNWTGALANAVKTSISFTRPFDGCRIKAIWGFVALHNSANGMVCLRPLSSISPVERSYENIAGVWTWAEYSGWGIEVGIHQDTVSVSMYKEGFINNGWPGGNHESGAAVSTYNYDGIKVKVFVEFMA